MRSPPTPRTEIQRPSPESIATKPLPPRRRARQKQTARTGRIESVSWCSRSGFARGGRLRGGQQYIRNPRCSTKFVVKQPAGVSPQAHHKKVGLGPCSYVRVDGGPW